MAAGEQRFPEWFRNLCALHSVELKSPVLRCTKCGTDVGGALSGPSMDTPVEPTYESHIWGARRYAKYFAGIMLEHKCSIRPRTDFK